MRSAHLVSRVVVSIVLAGAAGGIGSSAVAADDDLDVTTNGVTYRDRDQRAHEDQVTYAIRSLDEWRFEWLTEPMSMGRAGEVPFTKAPGAMPDGYCVTYVRVPGVGEFRESSGGQRCTGTSTARPPSSSDQTTTAPQEPKDEPAPEPEPTSAEPTPEEETPSPTPTPSPSRSASASPSATPSPTFTKTGPTPSPSAVPLADGPAGGEPGDSDLWSAQDRILDGETWAAIGLGLAAVGVAVGGAVALRARFRAD
ncbi:hypothetical protein [Isoptericola sp. 178]|uniref:hypothetical protein n=1 Tax=Isoptericola sp. 178 TaxID=3064651 RepID=UPI0027123F20|nr:hypothetical protein [Isoptericola sp. 178]MDO8143331.1 hypothetical protein [Isoptericola sp. 178]